MSGLVNGLPVASSRLTVFAPGTKMVFNQTASPTGWTKVTSANDVALRLVSGTVGTGGSVAFETAFASQTSTASSGSVSVHTLAVGELPAHTHYIQSNTTDGTGDIRKASSSGAANDNHTGAITVTHGGSHTHGFTQPTISAIDLNVSFVDVIIATKD